MLTDAPNLDVAAKAYELLIRAHVSPGPAGVPAFDAMVLGVGDDGHTASLFPGEPTVDIRDRFVAVVPMRGAREARMTLTVPLIQNARTVLVLAVGVAKAPALQRVWADSGDVHVTPARIIRECKGDLAWIVDPAAGSASA